MDIERTEREIIYLKPDKIKPDPDQPRKRITDEMIEGMALSIKSEGLIKPIEVDDDNVIVTGEIRWRGGTEAGLELIPCIRWNGTLIARHTRQLIENLHHYELSSVERENGIYELWREINPELTKSQAGGKERTDSVSSLARILGYDSSGIRTIIRAKEFRDEYLKSREGVPTLDVSTYDIRQVSGAEPEQAVKILEAVASDSVASKDIADLKEIAKASDELLEKALEGEIPIERARRTADSLIEVEKRVAKERDEPDFKISNKDKTKLIKKIAEDEQELDEYKETVLTRSVNAISISEEDREKVVQKPVGRKNPAEGLMKLIDNLNIERWTLKIRMMDFEEKKIAKRYLLQILSNVNKLLEFMPDET